MQHVVIQGMFYDTGRHTKSIQFRVIETITYLHQYIECDVMFAGSKEQCNDFLKQIKKLKKQIN